MLERGLQDAACDWPAHSFSRQAGGLTTQGQGALTWSWIDFAQAC